MFSNFEPNFIDIFFLGKCFFKFWSSDFFAKRKFVFGRHIVIFADGRLGVNTWYNFRTEIHTGKYSKVNGSKGIEK